MTTPVSHQSSRRATPKLLESLIGVALVDPALGFTTEHLLHDETPLVADS
jgi:hypothetical protein